MFGSSQGTGLFGAKPAGGGLFGSSTTNTGSTFGSSTTTGGSLFGKPTGTSMFGSAQPASSGGLFGGSSTTAANTSFGTATNTGGGLFGGSSQSNTGGSLFGKPAATTSFGGSGGGGGLFGSSTSTAAAPNGTTIKFTAPVAPDTMMKNGMTQNIQTKNFCISAMKEYEGKSFEELRVDDYIANRKAPAAGSTTGGGLFGASTSTTTTGGGLFGGAQQKPSLFGGSSTTTSSPFGGAATTQGTSLFGGNNNQPQQQQTAGGGLFGKPAGTSLFGGTSTAATGTFGAAQTAPASGGLFGKPATTASPFGGTGTTFGQTAQPAQTGGLFGGGTAGTTSTFGATANTSGGLFGGGTQTNTAAGGLFGKPATATTGSFGFGQTAQPAQAATGGLFGNTAAKGGGLFGATTTPQQGTGLFGTTPAQPAGGLFGAQTTQQTGGLFGSTAQQPAGSVVVQNPATVAVATQPIVLGSDVNETMLKMAMIEANLATNPYGDSPLLKLANSLDTDEKPNPVSAQRQMRFLKKSAENNVTTPSSTNGTPLVGKSSFLSMNVPVAGSKIRSRSIAVNGDLNYKSTRTPPTLGKGIGGKGNNTSIVSNTSFNSSFANKSVDPHIERALSNNSNTLPGSAKKVSIKHLDLDEIKSAMRNSSRQAVRSPRDADELPMTEEPEETENSINISVNADPRDAAYRRAEIQRQPPVHLDLNVTSDTNTSNHITSSIVSSPIGGAGGDAAEVFAPAGITLKTSDYFCEPTLRKMAEMVKNGEVYLPEGLTVGRATFGDVYWPGPLTLKDVALDEIVIFRHKEVTVYPDETKKPALGEGLNRPAEVTLERVWYVNRETKEEIKDPIMLAEIGWRDRLERVTLKMGALFKDYRPGTGSWVFKVEHFSKYGLVDDDDDENKAPKPLDEKQRSLQSRVQRTAIHSDQTFTIDNDEVPEEVEMEDIIFVTGSRAVPSALVQGLGGALDASCDMETGYDEHDLVVPPEKKPKIDLDGSSLYEDSKYLLEKLAQSQTFRLPREIHLKCVPATRKFEGGHRSRETKGFGVSRFIDLGSARGQVARVGWSSKGHFVQSLQPEKNSLLINSLSRSGNIQQDYVLDMLEHNIRFSQTIQRNHSISAKVRHHEIDGQHVAPRVKPTNDHAQLIDSFCATANQSSRNDEERVWKLARALLPGSREGRWRWDRLDAVCDWLREEVALLPKLKISGRGAKVWQALCRGQLEEAVAAAEEEGLMFMCTLLATFQVDPRATQQDFQAQIEFWEQFRMLEHLDEHVLKVYLLMAGRPSVKFTSKLGKKVTVGCCDGLPWKQAIGIYLWYLRSFQCFEETLDEATMQIPAPRDADDVLFCHLLKLSRDQAYSVEEVLDAVMDYSSSPFDVHLSWHLWTVLRSLGYNTMNPSAEQRLHVSYAEQLMANSLPHLALFVLSHISSDQARSAIMKESLDRFALTATRADYNRLLDIVSVPASWIASAKYVKAKMSGQNAAACEQAIKAGDYRTAFSTFVEDVAPNAVFSDDLDELERLVTLFEPVTDFIPSWGLQGQIYVDYVDFKRLSKSGDDEDDHRVAELINSLTAKLRAPVFETPIQRLAAQNIGLLMFEAHKMMNDSLEFQMPFDMASLMRELTRSVTATNTGGLF